MKRNPNPCVFAALATVLLATCPLHADDAKKEKPSPEKPESALSKEMIEAMEKSGLDPEILKKIKEAMEKGENGAVSINSVVVGPDGKVITQSNTKRGTSQRGGVESKTASEAGTGGVSISTTVIGPDGKVVTQKSERRINMDQPRDGQKQMTLDLGKLISEATAEANKASGGASATATGSADSKSSTKTTVFSSTGGKVVIVGEDGKVQTHSIGEGLESDAIQKALGEALGSIDIQMLDPENLKTSTQIFGFGPATIAEGDVSERLAEVEKELKEQRALLEKILEKL